MKWNLGFLRKKHARINFPVKNILQEKGNFDALNKVLLLFKGLRHMQVLSVKENKGSQLQPQEKKICS